ncbi:MFS transporter [Falsiroseomonas selenitidurans]|uniref:MFS transporter n=1 Tax=Falsiroseomonas selenitidurans TaxID=2716335 RepID=A0ABX1E573_9PROT|nr:MFS transporter [Falsiroseomonas selenitidurans]NKC32334.1 MFS transporter [Falsiroseomonas selenitidurans]
MDPPVWLMALAAFSIGCGMRMLDPLLPMLAREFGVGLGAVAPLIGGFALAYGIGQLVMGPLGDRFGKMRIVAISMGCFAATQLAASQAGDLGMLLTVRVLAGLACAAVMPLFMAHIGDSVPYDQRQAMIGKLLTGMVASQLLAAPLSGIIAETAGWRTAFLGLGLMAAGMTAFFIVRLGPGLWQAPAGGGRTMGLSGFLRILERKAGRRLLLAAGLDGFLLFGGAFPFLASLLIQRFGLGAAEAGLVVASFALGSFAYTQKAGWLAARLGERRMVLWGGAGLALALSVFALAPAWWMVAVAQCSVGLLFFMLHGVLQARATEALPEARGTAVAAFAMALFLGQSLGSVVFGSVIVAAGYTVAFLLAGAGVLAMAVWIRAGLMRPA